MEALGFDLRAQAGLATLTGEVVTTSGIEGVHLNADEVRSSVARRLALAALFPTGRSGMRRITVGGWRTEGAGDTALRDIRELVDRGILLRNPGGGRSTSYRLAEPGDVA